MFDNIEMKARYYELLDLQHSVVLTQDQLDELQALREFFKSLEKCEDQSNWKYNTLENVSDEREANDIERLHFYGNAVRNIWLRR